MNWVLLAALYGNEKLNLRKTTQLVKISYVVTSDFFFFLLL